MGILGIVGAALSIGGGSQASATNPNNGSDLRHAGVILYVALYGLILAVLFYFWINTDLILRHRRSVCYPSIIPLQNNLYMCVSHP